MCPSLIVHPLAAYFAPEHAILSFSRPSSNVLNPTNLRIWHTGQDSKEVQNL